MEGVDAGRCFCGRDALSLLSHEHLLLDLSGVSHPRLWLPWKHRAPEITRFSKAGRAISARYQQAEFWRLISVSQAVPEPEPMLNDTVCQRVIVRGLTITKCRTALGMT